MKKSRIAHRVKGTGRFAIHPKQVVAAKLKIGTIKSPKVKKGYKP